MTIEEIKKQLREAQDALDDLESQYIGHTPAQQRTLDILKNANISYKQEKDVLTSKIQYLTSLLEQVKTNASIHGCISVNGSVNSSDIESSDKPQMTEAELDSIKFYEKMAKGTFMYMMFTKKEKDANAFLNAFASVMNLTKKIYGCSERQYIRATKLFIKQMEFAFASGNKFDEAWVIYTLIPKLKTAPIQYNMADQIQDVILDHIREDSFFGPLK